MKSLVDNGNGVTSTIAVEDGNIITGTTQDCTPILDHVSALRNEGFHGSKDMRLAARVPMVVVEKYCNDKGITFKDFSNAEHHKIAFLNDPEYRNLRVWEGRV